MEVDRCNPEWWQAACALAEYVVVEDCCIDNNNELRGALQKMGFSSDVIQKAFEWIELASASGCMNDVIGMLQPLPVEFRIENPIERMYFSEQLWRKIGECRRKGIFTDVMVERILAAARSLDTRDWDDVEMEDLISDIIDGTGAGSEYIERRFELALNGHTSEIYS